MSIRICRLCLTMDEPLEQLNTKLLGHYNTFCKYEKKKSRSHSLLLSCLECKEALRRSLEFTNKCIKSYEIFQEWKKKTGLKKKPINSLKELLLISLNKTHIEKDEHCKTRNLNNYEIKIGTEINQHVEGVKIENEYVINENVYNKNSEKDDTFEVVNCDVIKYEVNNIKYEKLNKADANNKDEQNKGQSLYDQNKDQKEATEQSDPDMKYDSKMQDDDDDKFLIECVKETETLAKKGVRVYPRKGIIDFAKYESVFDIQLFNTDEDARMELQSRLSSEPYTSAKYRCERCYTVYKCEKLLQFHMKWHDSKAEFECDICRMRFATKKAERVHRAKCHRGKYSCRLCPLVTYYGSAMKAHFEKHQGKTHKCHCGAVFNHISSYLSHARTTHVSAHACVTCARTFVSQLGLRNHRIRAHQTRSLEDTGGGGVACSLCELTFPNQRVLNVHVLSTHKLSQAANDIIACRYCGLSFETPAQVKAHKREKHPRKEDANDMITCKLCGAVGAGRTWRYRHYCQCHPHVDYRTVSDAARHMCDQCGKLFTNVTCLKDHMNVHLGLRPHACGACGATFALGAALAQHRQRHAAPLVCPHCQKEFRSTANYAVHMRIHTGVRRHICPICSKAFLHRAALREHERGVHRSERRERRPR